MLQEEFSYWLANIYNIGVKKIDLLLQVFGSAEEIYRADKGLLEKFKEDYGSELRMSDADVIAILGSRDSEKIHQNYDKLGKSGINFVSKEEEHYPNRLRNIYGAPYALYVKGSLPNEEKKVLAVVGARECTQYGKEMAKYLAGSVAMEGIAIVSGLARGIDSYAHEGALLSGGITYGILGSGIDICYPRENINLYMEMQKEGGIISEYAPGVQPIAGNFPVRNRIISGLCDGILVIEAKEKSGSLITVDMGLEQGKDIYALPGRATDRLSGGCNNLIKMGAKLVTSPKDILEDFLPNYEQALKDTNNNLLQQDSKIVYASLSLEPKHVETIAEITNLPMDLLMEQLLLLELGGLVRQTMKNYYAL